MSLLALKIAGFAAFGIMFAALWWRFISEVEKYMALKWKRASKLARSVLMLGVAWATLFGGAKPGKIEYPRTVSDFAYFIDNGSALTNDVVHLDFTVSALVPEMADFRVDACEVCYTGDVEIVEHTTNLYLSTVGELPARPFDLPLVNATNYNVWVYSTWVPSSVKTNGVAEVLGWVAATNDSVAASVNKRTSIYLDGEKVAPVVNVTLPVMSVPAGGSDD